MKCIDRRSLIKGTAVGGLLGLAGVGSRQAKALNPAGPLLLSVPTSLPNLVFAAEQADECEGVPSLDLDQLEIGSPIPAYGVSAGTPFLAGYEYPLTDGYQILGTSFMQTESADVSQLGFSVASSLAEWILDANPSSIALVNDECGLMAFDGQTFTRLSDGHSIPASDLSFALNSAPLSTVQTGSCVAGTNMMGALLSTQVMLQPGNTASPQLNWYDQTYPIPNDYHYLPTSGVDQGSYPICWAACLAYIWNYTYNDDVTAEEAVRYIMHQDYHHGVPPSWIAYFLKEKLYLGNYTYYESTIPTSAVINYNITHYRPMVGHFDVQVVGGSGYDNIHAAVIMGYSPSTGVMGIHESNGGDFYFATPYGSTYQYFLYQYNGTTMYYSITLDSTTWRYEW